MFTYFYCSSLILVCFLFDNGNFFFRQNRLIRIAFSTSMYVASFSNCVIIGVGRDDRVLAVRIGVIRTVV